MSALTQLAQFAQQHWLLLALMAMFFAGLASITLKILVKNQGFLKMNWTALAPVAVLVLLALAAGWFFFLRNSGFGFSEAQLFWIAALAVFSIGTFACMTLALQTGKVALVAAVLSLNTVLVAVLSFVFFGDRFTAKQMLAIAFAVISLTLLVL